MLFSISPVQSFISKSRKTQDLYNGSRILSELTKTQMELLQNETAVEVIFPLNGGKFLPNRFLFKINYADEAFITELANKLMKNFQSQLLKLSFQSVDRSDPIFRAQINDYFKLQWTAVEMKDSYKKAYNELEKKHAGTKNLRMFQQLGNGCGEQGRKCSLCGEYNALIYKENSNRKLAFLTDNAIPIKSHLLKENEAICSICSLKRLSNTPPFPSVAEIAMKSVLLPEEIIELKKLNIDPEILYKEIDVSKYLVSDDPEDCIEKAKKLKNQIRNRCQNNGKKLPKYYALITYDGDSMGKLLSGTELTDTVSLKSFHTELAKSLFENAKRSMEIVDQVGKTVYAGGDDFLGFCSLDIMLLTLKRLRESFDQQVNQKLKQSLKPSSEITMSAGVVIAHYKTPLHIVLNWAKNMEKESKSKKGKNSVTLAVIKHSGDIQKVTWKWGEIIDLMQEILTLLRSNTFSTNFIYTLDEEFQKLEYRANESFDRQFESELKRLIKRSRIDKNSKNENSNTKLYETCLKLRYSFIETEDYFSLMRIIAFLYRELGGE
jgi:CRISPR-associated protein Cmr2